LTCTFFFFPPSAGGVPCHFLPNVVRRQNLLFSEFGGLDRSSPPFFPGAGKAPGKFLFFFLGWLSSFSFFFYDHGRDFSLTSTRKKTRGGRSFFPFFFFSRHGEGATPPFFQAPWQELSVFLLFSPLPLLSPISTGDHPHFFLFGRSWYEWTLFFFLFSLQALGGGCPSFDDIGGISFSLPCSNYGFEGPTFLPSLPALKNAHGPSLFFPFSPPLPGSGAGRLLLHCRGGGPGSLFSFFSQGAFIFFSLFSLAGVLSVTNSRVPMSLFFFFFFLTSG